jgi:hypothetical protein
VRLNHYTFKPRAQQQQQQQQQNVLHCKQTNSWLPASQESLESPVLSTLPTTTLSKSLNFDPSFKSQHRTKKHTHTKSTPTLSPSCSSSFPPLLLSSRCCHAGCVLPTDLDSSAVASVILTPSGCVHFARFLRLTSADARKDFDPIRHLISLSSSLVFFLNPWFFVGTPDWICEGSNRQISARCQAKTSAPSSWIQINYPISNLTVRSSSRPKTLNTAPCHFIRTKRWPLSSSIPTCKWCN